ncbi:hypothetical protein V8E52_009192 [Russula decolorans]
MKEVVELRSYLIGCSHDPVQVAMCINQSYCNLSPSPSPVPMHRRVTHLGTSLRKRASATESLIYRPRRTFSTTRVHHATHYDTLSIPRNASKSQIKSAYYKLSKKFHPDVNKEPQAREKFLAFSEAYAVLGDDRQRRSYDRSLVASGGQQSGYNQPPPTYSHYATANEARRRSANYAWERRHRPPPGSGPHMHHQHQHQAHPRSQTSSSSSSSSYASSDPYSRRATAGGTPHYHPPRTRREETELDHLNRVSGLGRALQLVGLFIAVAVVGTLGKR